MSAHELVPLALLVTACVLMYVALKHWHRTRTAPRPLRNHRKLLKEAARASGGVSRRQLKAFNSLATDAGLSSPLVALICPSSIGRMAGKIREDRQRVALRALAEDLVRAERKRSTRV